jgi:hypothetical protein
MEWLEPWSSDGLTVWFQSWVEGFITFMAACLLALLAVAVPVALAFTSGPHEVRRRFWCRLAGRDVEVQFVRRGLFKPLVSVQNCSAFESGEPACRRRCINRKYRRQWEPSLPVLTRPGGTS